MSTLSLPGSRTRSVHLPALVLLASAAMALDVGVTRITYGVALAAIRRDLDLSFAASGVLASAHLVGYLLGSVIVPALTRRWRLAVLCAVSHLALGAGMLASAFAADALALGAARASMGIAAGVGISTAVALTLAAAPVAQRSAVSAIIWAGIGVAVIASGAAVQTLLDAAGGWRSAHLVGAALAVVVAACFLPVRPARASGAPRATASPATKSPRWGFLMASYFAFGAAYLSYSTFAGTELAALGATRRLLSTFWIVLGGALVLGALACVVLVRHPEWRNRALWMALAAGALGASVTLLPGTAALVGSAFIVGLGLAATPAMTTAFVRERSTDAQYLHRFSVATAWLALGQIAGPVIAGALADALGPGAASLFAACTYACSALLAGVDARLHPARHAVT